MAVCAGMYRAAAWARVDRMKAWTRDAVMCAIALAVLLLFAFTPYDEPLIVLMPVLVISAYVGGLRTGLIVTALTTASAAFLVSPDDSVSRSVLRISALALSGALVSVMCEMLLRAKRRAQRSER